MLIVERRAHESSTAHAWPTAEWRLSMADWFSSRFLLTFDVSVLSCAGER
jgi:hypothetical protein